MKLKNLRFGMDFHFSSGRKQNPYANNNSNETIINKKQPNKKKHTEENTREMQKDSKMTKWPRN